MLGPSGADILFLAVFTVFVVTALWILWRESRIRELWYAMVVIAVAVLSMIYYAVIAPYYTVVGTGEYISYVVPRNVTATVNGSVTTIQENVTVVSPVHVVNPVPSSYFPLILIMSIILVLFAFYYIIKWITRLPRI